MLFRIFVKDVVTGMQIFTNKYTPYNVKKWTHTNQPIFDDINEPKRGFLVRSIIYDYSYSQ